MLTIGLKAQDISLPFQLNSILFKDFVDTLEKSVPVKIYYSDTWVDSMYITTDIRSTLTDLLSDNGFNFYITDDNKIVLSKGYSIKSNFKEEYIKHINKLQTEKDDLESYYKSAYNPDESVISDEYKVFRIGKQSSNMEGLATLSGKITSAESGTPIPGVIVYVEQLKAGAMSNAAGFYSIQLPKGQQQIEYRMVGLRTTNRTVILYSNGSLDITMNETSNMLDEIIISAERENKVRNVKSGIEKISTKILRQIPLGLGESDVVKSSTMLPGVQTVGEAASGYNVRGGNTDQNLILINNAPIFNSSHFFGLFSAFNSDLVKEVTLYKNSMHSKYGGRLSSVMEITQIEGNNEKIKVSGGISPVTTRLLVEGPIKKNKTSFAIGGRTTYSDWILGMLKDRQLQKSSAGFWDIQAVFSGKINNNDSYSISGYYSLDHFDYYKESAFEYGNKAATLKWKHTFTKQLSAQFYAIASGYNYSLNDIVDSVSMSTLSYNINQNILRADFLYLPSSKHKVEFGLEENFYLLSPGNRKPYGVNSIIVSKSLEKERATEAALYFSDEFDITDKLLVSGGIRSTLYANIGEHTEYEYADNMPLTKTSVIDTTYYKKFSISNLYPALDIRFSARYTLASTMSVKMGYQKTSQFIHMVSNNTSISPTDVWTLSDKYIKPQKSDQISVGFFHTTRDMAIESSVELYYKWMKNSLDYKSGAILLMNEHLETDIIQGIGKAYGIEFMIKKQTNAITGWISYTYSRVFLKTDSKHKSERINNGEFFPANYDKPHDLKVVANAKISRRINVSSNFTYNTGRPITYPTAFFTFNGASHVYYSKRNDYRIPDYMRLDMSVTLNGNLKNKKLNHSSLTATVYNVLGRKNPYSIYFKTEDGVVKGYQMSIFARPIFMITYNFKILGNASDDF